MRGASGREVAYDFIRTHLLADPAVHDTFVSEEDIARRAGVSRTPVREALMILSTENLVRLVPRRGVYVAAPSSREVHELIEFRMLLERAAVTQAVAGGQVDVAAMESLLEQQRALTSGGSQAREFIDLDFRFHLTLIDATDNAFVRRSYERIQSQQLRAGVVAVFRDTVRRENVIREHGDIIAALKAGDAEWLESVIEKHLGHTLESMLMSHGRSGSAR